MQSLTPLAALSGLLLLCSCAGFGIVATDDPLRKLNDAADLAERQGRPLPAETLVRQAMAIYEERNDMHGLGHAYRQYGDLLTSWAVKKWEAVYRRDGFRDKSITFDNRLEKASEFYRKALTYYERAEQGHQQGGKYDALTNLYFNMGNSHYMLDERDKACSYWDKALQAYGENMRRNPAAKPAGSLPQNVRSNKQQAACPL